MPDTSLNLGEHILPPAPVDEIPRNVLVKRIAAAFGSDCQQQMVVGGAQTGKTNVLAQFVRQYRNCCISYFITASPWSQRKFAFLYAECCQLSSMLGTNPPPQDISLERLEDMFTALTINLARQAKTRKTAYYFVIDGLERALEGLEDERIIDLFPLETAPDGPYLLFSCRPNMIDRLPESLRACRTAEPIEFERVETEQYLSGLGLSHGDILDIQDKYNGIPGYLKIIKATKLADPAFDLSSAPQELDHLIRQQVKLVMETTETFTREALEIMSVSPAPLLSQVLAEMTQNNCEPTLVEALQRTDLVRFDLGSRRLEFSNDLVKDCIRSQLGNRAKPMVETLLQHVREKHPSETFLLTLLYKEAQDYQGISNALSVDAVIKDVDATGGISNIIGRLRAAADMAKENHETIDLVRWTLGIAAAKSFVSHAVSIAEIRALLSIGETQAALSRAYAISEPSIKIRLLAKAYNVGSCPEQVMWYNRMYGLSNHRLNASRRVRRLDTRALSPRRAEVSAL